MESQKSLNEWIFINYCKEVGKFQAKRKFPYPPKRTYSRVPDGNLNSRPPIDLALSESVICLIWCCAAQFVADWIRPTINENTYIFFKHFLSTFMDIYLNGA